MGVFVSPTERSVAEHMFTPSKNTCEMPIIKR